MPDDDQQWNCADCRGQLLAKQRKKTIATVVLKNGHDYDDDIYDDERSSTSSSSDVTRFVDL